MQKETETQKKKRIPSRPKRISKPAPETLALFDMKGKKAGEVTLEKSIFDGDVNVPVLHQVIVSYQARQRLGTSSTKTRKDVTGGGKKPWRQKGTGRARAGSIRSPIWRKGGIVFGPHPRSYAYSVPQGMKNIAVRSGLNSKLADEKLHILDKLDLKEPRTKLFKTVLDSLKITKSVLVVIDRIDRNVLLASRNMPRVTVKTARDTNAWDILRHEHLIMTETALKNISERIKLGMNHE